MKVVLCNCPVDVGSALARALVLEGLAACVNVLPGVTSVYRWQGEVCEDEEVTLLIKVAAVGVGRLADAIRGRHPYEQPEIVVLDVDTAASDPGYVAWVRAMTSAAPHPETEG